MQSMLREKRAKWLMGSVGSRILWVLAFMFVGSVVPLHADLVGIDQIIYQNGTGIDKDKLSGELDISVGVGNQLIITMKNTTTADAFDNTTTSPVLMLLTGFGIQLPGTLDIAAGSTVGVNPGSTVLNVAVQPLHLNNQYIYANNSFDGYNMTGVLPISDAVSSVANGGADFRFDGQGPTGNPPNGPNYGAISNALAPEYLALTGNQEAVQDTVRFVLNLTGTGFNADTIVRQIDDGNVILAFGSPDSIVPEPSTYALYGLGIAMLIISGWWQKRRSQGNTGLAA